MGQIVPLAQPDAATLQRLLAIWEASVAATHHFLPAAEREGLRPFVEQALANIGQLYGWQANGRLLGFVGVQDGKIEMLFVDAAARGQGIGRQLLNHATAALGARLVDVNEQNEQGVGFYRRMGFVPVGRSALDGQGRPYPLLHLKLGLR